jgi:hypothetical protein
MTNDEFKAVERGHDLIDVLSQVMFGGMEENHEKCQSG